MNIIDNLLTTLPDGKVREVPVGAFWTAVVADVGGRLRCGLASTLHTEDHHHGSGPAVCDAGQLVSRN